jgi:hypothetical protein
MRRIVVLLLGCLLLSAIVAFSPAVAAGKEERGPGLLRYDVGLAGDASGRSWTGRESIGFANTTGKPLGEVYLRLWGNAWDGCEQPVKVSNFSGGVAGALTVNCTVLKIELATVVAVGKRAVIGFDLTMTAPERLEQFGRSGAYSFFGNALPVLAVHDSAGWQLEPDVGIGESYYTLAADFVVRLQHPAAVQVPATGITSTALRGKTVTTTSIAKQVRDFAFAAGPFRQSTATSPGGVKVRTWWTDSVPPAAVADARPDALTAIDDFSRRFGAYPYGELDLVLNGKWTSFSGMEYPGFVLLVAPQSPVVHELAHQWWYGIVGNNEYADPWLDESFAVYATDLHDGDAAEGCWPGTLTSSIGDDMGHWKSYGGNWGVYVYTYGACLLHDLERVLGAPAMATMLRAYAKSHWYGVSTVADFKSAAQSATSVDLTSFWTTHTLGA